MAPRVALSRIAAVLARLSSPDTRRRPRPAAARARLLRVEGLEERELLAAQSITPSVTTFNVDPGAAVVFDAMYSNTDLDPTLTGLGLRLHYNSSKITPDAVGTSGVLNGLKSVFSGGKQSNMLPADDTTTNYDNDATTDKYIFVAWADADGLWPGQFQADPDFPTLPQRLYQPNFHAVTGANAVGTTYVRFSASSTSGIPGSDPPEQYDFTYTPATISFNVAAAIVDAGGPYFVAEGGSLQLDGSGTTHPVEDPATLLYEWDFTSDGTYDASGVNLVQPPFPVAGLDGPAAITVTLRVTDSNLMSATDTATVNISNALPTAMMTGPLDGYRGVPGQLRTFTVSATDPSVADMAAPFTYTIDWGDGQISEVTGPALGTPASHTYTTAGTTYTPSVVAKDKDNGSSAPVSGPAVNLAQSEKQGANVALGGTTADDTVVVAQPGRRAGQLSLTLNGSNGGTYTLPSNGKLQLFGQGGAADSITVNGTASTDRLQVTSQGVLLNGYGIEATDFETWAFGGLAGTDTLVGANVANTWVVGATTADAGTLNASAFTGMEKLVGGTSTDDFQINYASKTYALVDGGGGGGALDYSDYGHAISLNLATSSGPAVSRYQNITEFVSPVDGTTVTKSTLRAGNGTNTWVISGENSGTINGAAFSGFTDLMGGRGADTFNIGTAGSVTGVVDGATGCDVLNYSAFASTVTVNLATGAATGLGTVRNFRMVIGGSGDDFLTAGTGSMALVGGLGIDTLQGGAGRDILLGGAGVDTLNGGAGQDMLYGSNSFLDIATLDTVLQQWNRSTSYESRVAKLGGLIAMGISEGALSTDGVADNLYGEEDRDWFLTFNSDSAVDADEPLEVVTDLDGP